MVIAPSVFANLPKEELLLPLLMTYFILFLTFLLPKLFIYRTFLLIQIHIIVRGLHWTAYIPPARCQAKLDIASFWRTWLCGWSFPNKCQASSRSWVQLPGGYIFMVLPKVMCMWPIMWLNVTLMWHRLCDSTLTWRAWQACDIMWLLGGYAWLMYSWVSYES